MRLGAHTPAEMGAHGAFHGVTMRTWVTDDGVAEARQVEELLAPDAGPYLVSTACVAVENTHNFGGGTIQPVDTLTEISSVCRDAGVGLHLDGARLWNAHVATGVPLEDYGRLFDTVNVCLSKGLGAPVGSVLVGAASVIAGARTLRKRLGAGWRQAGILAAAGLYALEHNIDRLAQDHEAALAFADAVAERAGGVREPQTTIVGCDTGEIPAAEVAAVAPARVLVSALGARMLRAVTHMDVTVTSAAGRVAWWGRYRFLKVIGTIREGVRSDTGGGKAAKPTATGHASLTASLTLGLAGRGRHSKERNMMESTATNGGACPSTWFATSSVWRT